MYKVSPKMSDIKCIEIDCRRESAIMRIESYTKVQQAYGVKKSNKTQSAQQVGGSDQLDISNMGRVIQFTKQAVTNTPDVREDLVNPLKEQMDAGTYQVDSGSFADKLMAKYEEVNQLYK